MATNWRKRPRVLKAVAVSGPGVAHVVSVKGRLELRVYTSHSSALAGGLSPNTAETLFSKGPNCGARACSMGFTKNFAYVWCEDVDCMSRDCECHLFDVWTDKEGDHEEDRGYPGQGWQFKVKPGHTFACRCTLRPA
jgi:hypothetical protein